MADDPGHARADPGDRLAGLKDLDLWPPFVPSSAAAAHYLPERVLTNDELAEHGRHLATSGSCSAPASRQRHIAAEGETTSMLGLKAAERALADAGLEPNDIDLIVVRDLDAGLHLPGDGDADPGRARHPPRRRLRPAGGVHRLRLRASRRPTSSSPPARTSAPWSSAPRPSRASSTGRTAPPACCSATAPARSCSRHSTARARRRIAAS